MSQKSDGNSQQAETQENAVVFLQQPEDEGWQNPLLFRGRQAFCTTQALS